MLTRVSDARKKKEQVLAREQKKARGGIHAGFYAALRSCHERPLVIDRVREFVKDDRAFVGPGIIDNCDNAIKQEATWPAVLGEVTNLVTEGSGYSMSIEQARGVRPKPNFVSDEQSHSIAWPPQSGLMLGIVFS